MKKFCLVVATDTFVREPLLQALIGLAINGMYLVQFEVKRPMLWFSSKSFENQNLFHVLERGASIACVVGSVMAALGAGEADLVGLVGGVFAGVNLVYVSFALYVFAKDTKLKRLGIHPEIATDSVCAKEMREWDDQVRIMDVSGGVSVVAKEDIMAELLFVRSKVALALERAAFECMIAELGADKNRLEELLDNPDENLRKEERTGVYEENVRKPESVRKEQRMGKEEAVKLVEGEKWLKAAKEGKLAVLRAFIEVGGRDLDEKNEYGYTALCLAAGKGHLEVVTALVQAGAGVDVGDEGGDTPLSYAAFYGHLEMCENLIEDGKASVNQANKGGKTPLKDATDEGQTAVIAYLESKGATLNGISSEEELLQLKKERREQKASLSEILLTIDNAVTKINADSVRLEVGEELLPDAREFVRRASNMNESNKAAIDAKIGEAVGKGCEMLMLAAKVGVVLGIIVGLVWLATVRPEWAAILFTANIFAAGRCFAQV